MGKISQAAKDVFNDRVQEYKDQVASLEAREKKIRNAIAKDDKDLEYKKLALADELLNIAALYLLQNGLSESLLGNTNSDLLDGARRSCYRSVILVEEVVSNVIDAPFSEYSDRLERIERLPDDQRYRLVQKMGFTIQSVEEAFGSQTKWKWSFVELEGRYTTVTKNLMNLKTIVAGLDPRVPGYEERLEHIRFVKDLLQRSADRYREKYELKTFRIDDFKQAISFLSALKRIHTLLGEAPQSDVVKRKIEVWKAKMEDDEKKLEATRPS
jgi:hypothetical protein